MEKPFVKSLTAVAVGAGAIGICLFGYHINNQRQHQQRINYAEAAITNQKDTLTSLSALCQMMLVKRNLRIIGDQVDQFLLIFFS
ncbi:hypothetical protein [Enterococcus faecium]|uniref:hypothetical protein n=1 Tax=Enterococcus faecium TaxID=1352 RepID=UPI001E571E5D|nr:hypothetical protein [Enterococcus faecium]MCE3178615.1 hypothetical protein [Enterococcus faecium]